MTDDERSQGRWEGEVSTRLDNLEESRANIAKLVTDLSTRTTKIESKQSIMWAVGAGAFMLAGGSLFKLWANGGF